MKKNLLLPLKKQIGVLTAYICGLFIVFVPGYGASETQKEEIKDLKVQKHIFAGDSDKHKNIFVFLDGTGNTSTMGTNVFKLYKLVTKNNDPQLTAIYIEGVEVLMVHRLLSPHLGMVWNQGF